MSRIPTPCFVLEEQKLVNNLKTINHVKSKAGIDIILALKGFAMWSAFPLLKKYVLGATASSLNEALLCKEKMGTLSHTYCVAYDDQQFDEIVSLSSHITFNSLSQYERFESRVPGSVSIGLRVNPEQSDVETGLYDPSSPVSRLGIKNEMLKELPARVEGLHFHALCESDSYALEKVLVAMEQKFGHILGRVKWVNMGGGHLMTRKGYDLDHLINLLKRFKEKHNVGVILEPGSAFAWETGDLIANVLDVVENGGTHTAIINASFTCHMLDCLEMPYRPAIKDAHKEQTEGAYAYRIGGVSCLAGDFLESYWFEKPLQVGDRVVFHDMIHYTMVKTTMFNGVKHPSIGILKQSGDFELIREFSYEDFKGRLS